MKNIIKIEYCTAWGYLGRAVALARSILSEHKNTIFELKLIPSSGGALEVSLNDELVFSKKELDRYPEKGEVEELIRNKLA
mgnify:FL=1